MLGYCVDHFPQSLYGNFNVYLFLSVCEQVTERKDELAKLEAIDCGKPLDEAAWDMVRRNLNHLFWLY